MASRCEKRWKCRMSLCNISGSLSHTHRNTPVTHKNNKLRTLLNKYWGVSYRQHGLNKTSTRRAGTHTQISSNTLTSCLSVGSQLRHQIYNTPVCVYVCDTGQWVCCGYRFRLPLSNTLWWHLPNDNSLLAPSSSDAHKSNWAFKVSV